MYEQERDGLLAGQDPAPPMQAPDPLDAVMAVAGPRGEDPGSHPRMGEDGGGVVVETKVTVGNDGKDGENTDGNHGYGEFSWPDGYQADPQAMAKFVPLARKLGLSKESAQSLADLYAELDCERERVQSEFIARNNAEWLQEVRNHPEFGGANLERTSSHVASLMRRYGSPTLVAQIRQMNVQNWPEMFFFLARVSQALTEDYSPAGDSTRSDVQSTARLLFPDLN